jgi:hypothetical protein
MAMTESFLVETDEVKLATADAGTLHCAQNDEQEPLQTQIPFGNDKQ